MLYVHFGTCTGYSFGLNRQRTLFWSVISWNVIYKNFWFRFAKPNMSSMIIGCLVGARDGKILGFKKTPESWTKFQKKKIIIIYIYIFFLPKSPLAAAAATAAERDKKKLKRFLFKFVSVLLSASVERVGVSCMGIFQWGNSLFKTQLPVQHIPASHHRPIPKDCLSIVGDPTLETCFYNNKLYGWTS